MECVPGVPAHAFISETDTYNRYSYILKTSSRHPPLSPAETTSNPVLLFDGMCRLCNAWVDFVLEHDRRGTIRLAALQSEAARDLVRLYGGGEEPVDSVLLVKDGRIYQKSEAILQLASTLGGIWKILLAGYAIPCALRDRLYDVVARNRIRWFGRRETCRLPDPEQRHRFLDEEPVSQR